MVAGNASALYENIQDAAQQLDTLATNSGAKNDAAVTDYTVSASEIALLKGIIKQLATGGTSGTQYTDGATAPAHPIGNQIIFNNGGTETAVSAATPLPVNATLTPPANQRVNAQSGDIADGALATLGAKADAKNSATDTTAITAMQILKQLSYMLQNPASTPVTGTFWQATQPVSAASLPLPTGAAKESGGNLDSLVAALGAIGDAAWGLSGNGDAIAILKKIALLLNAALSVSQSGIWTIQPGNTANTTPWLMQDVVASSGGAVPYHNLSAASTNFTGVKTSACQMYGYTLSNTSGSIIYVKFYDKNGAPTTGDTPKRTVMVPANGVIEKTIPKGLKFTSGFGWAATGAVADNDNTNIAANCVIDFDLNS